MCVFLYNQKMYTLTVYTIYYGTIVVEHFTYERKNMMTRSNFKKKKLS